MDDIARLETLAGRLGLANEADVVKAFGRVVEYGEGYFRMLASHAGYDEWHCTDANFYVLALICNFVEQLAVDDLMALNWDETFAKRVLTTTLRSFDAARRDKFPEEGQEKRGRIARVCLSGCDEPSGSIGNEPALRFNRAIGRIERLTNIGDENPGHRFYY
ncbi:hypothetical protein GQ56_0111655 [Burkholderia paludis]|uniref:hypothetical protein n=1 Tax=Burkholderia paludis TaxID=1506587 RepID=UPI0004DB7931|nr:hypothetical protein [Burkholderia paludis]KFG97202.1 hypothetical protein GQ56_0111655 [Burkholderia paludis]